MKTTIFSASIFLLVFFLATQDICAKNHQDTKVYKVHATVKKIYRHEKKITLDHEKIEGYMNAMVMTFPVADSSIFDHVSIWTEGIFTLRVEKGFATVTKVKVTETKPLYYCPM